MELLGFGQMGFGLQDLPDVSVLISYEKRTTYWPKRKFIINEATPTKAYIAYLHDALYCLVISETDFVEYRKGLLLNNIYINVFIYLFQTVDINLRLVTLLPV